VEKKVTGYTLLLAYPNGMSNKKKRIERAMMQTIPIANAYAQHPRVKFK
jgi:hypothetical protein